MRTFLTLFVLAALAGTAAPTRTLDLLSCTAATLGHCVAGDPFTLTGDGYSPDKLYIIVADDGITTVGGEQLRPDGTGTITATSGGVAAGTWTFTIYPENHNATPNFHRALQSVTITFD